MVKKAQVGLELITSVFTILIVLVLITAYSIGKNQEASDIKSFIDAKRVCNSIGDNLDAIQEQGGGYYKYFQLPDYLQGNHEYNVTVQRNVVEVSWEGKAWAVPTIAPNVTTYCLDKGLNETNRIINRGSSLEVTCHRPNLKPSENPIKYWNNNGNVTISLKIENDAHVDSEGFNVSIDSGTIRIDNLDSYEWVVINQTIYNMPQGGYIVAINLDSEYVITESIETDNSLNYNISI